MQYIEVAFHHMQYSTRFLIYKTAFSYSWMSKNQPQIAKKVLSPSKYEPTCTKWWTSLIANIPLIECISFCAHGNLAQVMFHERLACRDHVEELHFQQHAEDVQEHLRKYYAFFSQFHQVECQFRVHHHKPCTKKLQPHWASITP